MSDGQAWFLAKQLQIMERAGELVLLTIKMAFETWFEVEINTFTGRMGMAGSRKFLSVKKQYLQSHRQCHRPFLG